MASEWTREPLLNLCEKIVDCPHSTPVWTETGVVVIRNQNIRGGRLDLTDPSFTDEAHYEQRSRRARLRGGDVIITREAPMGEVCLVPDGLRCCLGQRMVMLRPDSRKCNSRFLLYSLQSPAVQHEIKVNEGTGSTVSNLRIPLLEALPITHPSLPEQQRIAHILGTLDDKIELNRRMNATLEAMARALFQSWFVDFDPVRAKAAGQTPAGLDPSTADLFPSEFEDSELGGIPNGWKIAKLGEVITPAIGGQWGEDNPGDGLIAAVCLRGCDMEDLRSNGWSSRAPTRFIKESALEKRIMRDSDLLIASSGAGPCGRPLWASPQLQSMHNSPVIYSNFVKRFSTLSKSHAIFVDRLLHEKFLDRSISEFITGTSVPNLDTNGLLATLQVVIPPTEVLNAFASFCELIFQKLYSPESRQLAALRDALLPKLLSGAITIENAYRSIEGGSTER